MNMNLYGYGQEIDEMEWIVVDVGITFADETIPGIDVIMPEHSFIRERSENLLGIIITHAHEDHVGGLAYLWPDLECPIYATPFTAALLRAKLAETDLIDQVRIHEVALGARFARDRSAAPVCHVIIEAQAADPLSRGPPLEALEASASCFPSLLPCLSTTN